MAQQEHEQAERERVLSEYGAWRLRADEDAPAAEEVRTLETLLRLKAERLGSPTPGLWTAQLARDLLTEVVPRTVVQPREQLMDMVPTLRRLLAFLADSGRWEEGSMSAVLAPALLHDLEFAALEAADDPSRRSFSTNVLGHGLSLGVELEDEEALADYMHWFHSLPDQERLAVSGTGRLPAPSVPFDPVRARRERLRAEAEDTAADAAAEEAADAADPAADPSWPWFLPPLADDGAPLGELAEQEGIGPYLDCALVVRAGIVLEVVGEGRRATATGALGRDGTAELLERLGLEGGARSLWDRPELAGVWTTLLDGGWLELGSGTVRAATGPVPAARPEDAEGFVEFGHALLTAALLGRRARAAEDGGFRGMPDTIAALLVACSDEGLRLPPGPRPTAPDGPELARLLHVLHDLGDLADCGVLTHEDGVFRGGPAVMLALVGLLRRNDPR
jgi:hypothetical protein